MSRVKQNANLTPFVKGSDPKRNLKGRPPKLPALDKLLEEVLGAETDDITAAQLVIQALLKKARAGDVRAAEVLLDRAYGKVKITVDQNVTQRTTIIDTTGEYNPVQSETSGS